MWDLSLFTSLFWGLCSLLGTGFIINYLASTLDTSQLVALARVSTTSMGRAPDNATPQKKKAKRKKESIGVEQSGEAAPSEVKSPSVGESAPPMLMQSPSGDLSESTRAEEPLATILP